MLAGLQYDFGETQKARKLIDLGLKLEPDHPNLLCEKGFYLCDSGNYSQAYDCYVQAEEIRPWATSVQKARAIRGQGAALIDLGRLREAEKQFERSLKYEPDNKLALSELKFIKDKIAAQFLKELVDNPDEEFMKTLSTEQRNQLEHTLNLMRCVKTKSKEAFTEAMMEEFRRKRAKESKPKETIIPPKQGAGAGASAVDQSAIQQDLKSCAEELHLRLAKAQINAEFQNYFVEPLLGCDALGKTNGFPLLSWLYFNPFGPTSCGLFSIPVPDKQEGILAFNLENPFVSKWAAFGVIPYDAPYSLSQILARLFDANGYPSLRLFDGLPTSIYHAHNWELDVMAPLISGEEARILFRLAARSLQTDLKTTCDYLLRYKGDPWERTKAEFEESLLCAMTGIDDTKKGFDRDQFNMWFDLVTGLIHIRSERNNLQAAWQGAIQNASRQR